MLLIAYPTVNFPCFRQNVLVGKLGQIILNLAYHIERYMQFKRSFQDIQEFDKINGINAVEDKDQHDIKLLLIIHAFG